MLPNSSLPADASSRLGDLVARARGARSLRDAEHLARLSALSDLGRRWLDGHGVQVRRNLEARVAEVERVGVPPSLFTLMGLSWYEKPYNRVLAWIVDPGAAHGAGRAALRGLAALLDLPLLAADASDSAAKIEILAEQTWPDAAMSTGEPDLVVLSPSLTLLVENKVLAEESGEGQYRGYLEALKRLAAARGTEWAAFLAAPSRRAIPRTQEEGTRWSGARSHAELADAMRRAADDPENSAWGRVACLLVARQLEYPDGEAALHRGARDLLARAGATPKTGDVATMRHMLARLTPAPLPWGQSR